MRQQANLAQALKEKGKKGIVLKGSKQDDGATVGRGSPHSEGTFGHSLQEEPGGPTLQLSLSDGKARSGQLGMQRSSHQVFLAQENEE